MSHVENLFAEYGLTIQKADSQEKLEVTKLLPRDFWETARAYKQNAFENQMEIQMNDAIIKKEVFSNATCLCSSHPFWTQQFPDLSKDFLKLTEPIKNKINFNWEYPTNSAHFTFSTGFLARLFGDLDETEKREKVETALAISKRLRLEVAFDSEERKIEKVWNFYYDTLYDACEIFNENIHLFESLCDRVVSAVWEDYEETILESGYQTKTEQLPMEEGIK